MLSKQLVNLKIFYQLKKLLKNFPFSLQKIESEQLKKIKRLLIYSYTHFDFYRELFNQAGFNPNTVECLEDTQRIPFMDKDMYREFSSSLVRKNPDLYKSYYRDGTSGSTGKPLTIHRTWNERAYMLAKYLRSLFLNGLRYRDVTFCLPSPHRISDSDSLLQKFGILRRECVSYTEPVENMVAGFLKSRADFLYANKSQLVQMARHIKDNKIEITRPRMINSSGEFMDISSRSLIEDVFGKDRMFEVYGVVECGNLAFQKMGENVFHFNHDTNIIELENEGKINKTRGRCIITDLNIFSFPLIRYRLDDWIEMELRDGIPVINRISGRDDDWISFRDGTRIPFHHFYEVMENKSMIRQFKFVQQSYERIDVLVILEKNTNRTLFIKQLQADLRAKISDSIEYRIMVTDQIPPDTTGKLRMVVSKI